METGQLGATERILEWFGINPDYKNTKVTSTESGELIYGSNLFIPTTKKAEFGDLARAINLLQHLRAMGENVPMNIWFVLSHYFNPCCQKSMYLYKSYFYKDIINQGVTSIDEIASLLTNGGYDIDDGSYFDTSVRYSITHGKVGEKIKQNTRFFKVSIDNDCWERWFLRYLKIDKESSKETIFDIYSFAEELKQPKYLKDFIEPLKSIPTKMAARMNKGSKLLSYVGNSDMRQAVVDSPRVKNMKYLCSEEGQKLIESKTYNAQKKYEKEYEITLDDLNNVKAPEVSVINGTVDEKTGEITASGRPDTWRVALLKKSWPGNGIIYTKVLPPFSPMHLVMNDILGSIKILGEFEFEKEQDANTAASNFEETKGYYLKANCCFEDRGYANAAHTNNLTTKFSNECKVCGGNMLSLQISEESKDKTAEQVKRESDLYNKMADDYLIETKTIMEKVEKEKIGENLKKVSDVAYAIKQSKRLCSEEGQKIIDEHRKYDSANTIYIKASERDEGPGDESYAVGLEEWEKPRENPWGLMGEHNSGKPTPIPHYPPTKDDMEKIMLDRIVIDEIKE